MINPEILRWVRERLGLSPDDVARASAFLEGRFYLAEKFSSADLMCWEAGEGMPSYPAEATLAEIYGCFPVSFHAETPPTTFHGQAPNSTWWRYNGGPFYYEPPVLLQPGEGEPDVPDLIRPGDWLEVGHEGRPYVSTYLVLNLGRVTTCVAGRIVHYWSFTVISLREARSSRPVQGAGSVNEVVAHGGRLRGLFQADGSTYRVLSSPPMERTAWPRWLRRKMGQMEGKQAQLSLFVMG